MPVSTKKKLNIDLFKGCAAHFDDSNVNERGNAIRQALKLCEDAGMRFSDAMAQAYPQEDSAELLQRIAELEAEIENKQQHIDGLESENADLKNGLEALNDELAEGHSERGRKSPRVFLFAVWGVIGARLLIGLQTGNAYMFPVDVVFIAVIAILLEHWVKAQLRAAGIGVFILKTLFLSSALWVLIAYMALGGRARYELPPELALLWSSFVMLHVVTRSCEWLAENISAFVHHPVSTVRGWFSEKRIV